MKWINHNNTKKNKKNTHILSAASLVTSIAGLIVLLEANNLRRAFLTSSPSSPWSETAAEVDLSAQHVLSHHQGESKKNMLIVGAGLGTTGTHFMFETTCHLGLPSLHFELGCIIIPTNTTWKTTANNCSSTASATGTAIVPEAFRRAAAKHGRLKKRLSPFSPLARCLTRQQQQRQPCGSALQWKTDTLAALHEVVADAAAVALHDTPYPQLLPHLLAMAKLHNRETVVLLSERHPTTYAKRRVGQDHSANDLICRLMDDDIEDDGNKNETILSSSGSFGAFDLIGCIDRALSSMSKEASTPDNDESVVAASALDLNQVFTTLSQVVATTESQQQQRQQQDHGIDFIAKATADYQEAVRQRADFVVNLFDKETPTTKESLAQQIVEQVPSIVGGVAVTTTTTASSSTAAVNHHNQKPKPSPPPAAATVQYVNWARGILVPDISKEALQSCLMLMTTTKRTRNDRRRNPSV